MNERMNERMNGRINTDLLGSVGVAGVRAVARSTHQSTKPLSLTHSYFGFGSFHCQSDYPFFFTYHGRIDSLLKIRGSI